MPELERLDELVQAVQSGPRYRQIYAGLVRRIGERAALRSG